MKSNDCKLLFGTLFCLVIWHLVWSIWSHSLKTPWVSDIEKTAQVPIEVRQMRRAVHQFGLVGGEDYDSKVFNRANPFTVSPRLTFFFQENSQAKKMGDVPTISETQKFETSPLFFRRSACSRSFAAMEYMGDVCFLFKCYGLTSEELLDVVGSEIRQSIQGW